MYPRMTAFPDKALICFLLGRVRQSSKPCITPPPRSKHRRWLHHQGSHGGKNRRTIQTTLYNKHAGSCPSQHVVGLNTTHSPAYPEIFMTLLLGVARFPKWVASPDYSIHPFRNNAQPPSSLVRLTKAPASICLVLLICWFQLDSFSVGGNWCTDWPLYSWISH